MQKITEAVENINEAKKAKKPKVKNGGITAFDRLVNKNPPKPTTCEYCKHCDSASGSMAGDAIFCKFYGKPREDDLEHWDEQGIYFHDDTGFPEVLEDYTCKNFKKG